MKASGLRPMLVAQLQAQMQAQLQAAIRPGQRPKLQLERPNPEQRTGGTAPGFDGTQLPVWLPVPLPDGSRGWVQLSVQERTARPDEPATGGSPAQRVRLLWETPRLGTVQVVLEGADTRLSALFTAPVPATRQALDRELPDLRERLASAGFPDALLGSRQPLPGERLEPAVEPSALVDRRM